MSGPRSKQPTPRVQSDRRNDLSNQETQRLAEFGWLCASLLHDLRAPLSAAMISLELLDKGQSSLLSRQAKRDLMRLENYITATQQYLRNASHPIIFSPTIAVHETVAMLRHQALKQNIHFRIKTDGRIQFYGDPIKFRRILANLLLNAIESYTVSCIGPKVILIQLLATSNTLKIVIQDNGSGISKAELPNIFERFYSSKCHALSGLGLANVKQFIEQDFRGSISVSSDRSGTIFVISLPVLAPIDR